MHRGETRELTVGDVIDTALTLYARSWRIVLRIMATTYLPTVLIFGIWLVVASSRGPFGDWKTAHDALWIALTAALALLTLLGSLWSTAACIAGFSDVYLGYPPEAGPLLRHALQRLPALILTSLLLAVGVGLGFIAFVIPGIWLIGAWFVWTPAVVLEGLGPVAALNRSRRLVSGRWWGVIGVALLAGFAVAVVNAVVNHLLGTPSLTGAHASLTSFVLVYVIGVTVTGAVIEPFSIAAQTVLYFDLRFRQERYDPWSTGDQSADPHGAYPFQ